MTSQVEVTNKALLKLGSDTIESFTEASNAARVFSVLWNTVRRSELMAYPWVFAKKQAILAASASAPSFAWDRRFPRQADDLRIVEIGEDQLWAEEYTGRAYDLAGRDILTDMPSPLNITYVSDVTDPAQFDAAFTESLAARLAFEGCLAVTGSNTLLGAMNEWHQQAIALAKRMNAIQMPPRMVSTWTPWTRSRSGYDSPYDRGWLWR